MTAREVLDGIKARLAAATPGPWKAWTTGRAGGDHWYVCDKDQSVASIHASDGEDEDQRQPDAVFIAAAPADVARLTAAVEAVLGITDRLAKSNQCEDREIAEDLKAAIEGALKEGQ